MKKQSIILFIDNNRVIDITKTYYGYKKTNQINKWCNFIEEKVKTGKFLYISSKNNIVDLLTKSLLKDITRKFTRNLGL